MEHLIIFHGFLYPTNKKYKPEHHHKPKEYEMNQIKIVDHPLIHHKMALIRQSSTSVKHFRELTEEISIILACETTKNCKLKQIDVNTPLENMVAQEILNDIVLVVILRAGMGMLTGFLKIIPNAKIGYLGVYRNEQTLQPVEYYKKLPPNLSKANIFLLDPMLATGGSAVHSISILKEQGAQQVSLVCLIAAPEGVKYVNKKYPAVKMYTAALDRELNDVGYILPGLGDAGDRLTGTL